MKIDILSDLHLDFWINPHTELVGKKATRTYEKFWEECLDLGLRDKNSNDVIVIAGDISHYNHQQISFFKFLKTKYKNILWTHGNHDLYLIRSAIEEKYENNSLNRLNEAVKSCEALGAKYLNGTTVDIDGIIFGGGSSWYDGNYSKLLNPDFEDYEQLKEYWKMFMNDYHNIFLPDHNWDDEGYIYYAKEQIKLVEDIILESDIIITHTSPNNNTIHTKYRGKESSGFYTYSSDLLNGGYVKDKIWIFGHTHELVDYTDANNNWYICNPLGYRGEKVSRGILTIDYTKH